MSDWFKGYVKWFEIMEGYGLPAKNEEIDVKKMVDEFVEAGIDILGWEPVRSVHGEQTGSLAMLSIQVLGKGIWQKKFQRSFIVAASDLFQQLNLGFPAKYTKRVQGGFPLPTEYIIQDKDGRRSEDYGACLNSPYAEHLKDKIKEIMVNLEADGIWIDCSWLEWLLLLRLL